MVPTLMGRPLWTGGPRGERAVVYCFFETSHPRDAWLAVAVYLTERAALQRWLRRGNNPSPSDGIANTLLA